MNTNTNKAKLENASVPSSQILNTLKTCKGQIDGILKMLEDNRYCIDVSSQIMAAQSLLAKANKLILVNHLETCVISAADDKNDLQEKTKELAVVLTKLLK